MHLMPTTDLFMKKRSKKNPSFKSWRKLYDCGHWYTSRPRPTMVSAGRAWSGTALQQISQACDDLVCESTGEDALLYLLTNKEETDRDVKVRNWLACSNHKVVEFQVLGEARKTNSTVHSTGLSTCSFHTGLHESRMQPVQDSSR